MNDIANSLQLPDEEYLPIWTTMMGTSQGRRFLSEFSRRTRASETRALLDSVQTLERRLLNERAGHDVEGGAQVREIMHEAAGVLESIVRINAKAASDIQDAADEIGQTARQMRRSGSRKDLCERLEEQGRDIEEIVAVQSIAAERTAKIAAALDALAAHIDALKQRDADQAERAHKIHTLGQGTSGRKQAQRRDEDTVQAMSAHTARNVHRHAAMPQASVEADTQEHGPLQKRLRA